MNRFKMSFNNEHVIQKKNMSIMSNISTIPKIKSISVTRSSVFKTPMIDRVHTAKPGCSACGKSVF
jgi:hypothetical protein